MMTRCCEGGRNLNRAGPHCTQRPKGEAPPVFVAVAVDAPLVQGRFAEKKLRCTDAPEAHINNSVPLLVCRCSRAVTLATQRVSQLSQLNVDSACHDAHVQTVNSQSNINVSGLYPYKYDMC